MRIPQMRQAFGQAVPVTRRPQGITTPQALLQGPSLSADAHLEFVVRIDQGLDVAVQGLLTVPGLRLEPGDDLDVVEVPGQPGVALAPGWRRISLTAIH